MSLLTGHLFKSIRKYFVKTNKQLIQHVIATRDECRENVETESILDRGIYPFLAKGHIWTSHGVVVKVQ